MLGVVADDNGYFIGELARLFRNQRLARARDSTIIICLCLCLCL
jgi:hypothetical protein